MRAITMLLLTASLPLALAAPARAQFALSWTGAIADGTSITVHGMHEDGPGAPGIVTFGDQVATVQPAAPDTIWAVFGDAPHLPQCQRTVLQGPLEPRGTDTVFIARLGPFTPDDTVTVFFVWNRSLQDEAYDPVVGVYLGASRDAPTPDPGPPGAPGRPVFTGG